MSNAQTIETAGAVAILRHYATYLPDGFRDEDGIWHDGPHRATYLDALRRLEALALSGERQ